MRGIELTYTIPLNREEKLGSLSFPGGGVSISRLVLSSARKRISLAERLRRRKERELESDSGNLSIRVDILLFSPPLLFLSLARSRDTFFEIISRQKLPRDSSARARARSSFSAKGRERGRRRLR